MINPIPRYILILSKRFSKMYTADYSHSTTRFQSFVEGATVAFKQNKGQLLLYRVSLVAQLVKNLPARQETWVRSLIWEDSMEKGKATHSSILA